MPALLIIGGLLLLALALLWLALRAFSRSLLWGCLTVLPPLTLLFVFKQWSRARAPMVLAGLAIIPLLIGLVMLANQDPQRLEALLSGHWRQPAAVPAAPLQIKLHGLLNGRPFTPDQAELVDGVLRLREGAGFYAENELVIRLGQRPKGPLRVNVLPADQGQLPEVEISWLAPGQTLPEARRLSQGYTLSLALQPSAPNKWLGDIHLVLPAPYKTSLTGKLELFSNGLRYRGDKVDRRIDSLDTLSYVIADYLERRFATRRVELQPLAPMSKLQPPLTLTVQATIKGEQQQVSLSLDKSAKGGWKVVDDSFPNLQQASVEATAPAAQPTPVTDSVAVAPAAAADRRQGFSLPALQANPKRYQGLRMRISTQGSSAQGRFEGLTAAGQLTLRKQISGSGDVSYRFNPQQIIQIELLEP
ncbi:MFS transporter [Pseudomonas sp. 5P_3.1_Bac2]|uniref:MFS transporter n=1 Tax=Pseudomonas sp. 5P_3.1_Bac2 TaxID=2971617 RepID=UPI0021C59241|nr:MFS transporter [Pseudomonas sp. 5P_3.1_Bac2]MCU1716924.1 MFS transporter [Pseudomonas sp. 5P_3.1_Bac2]